MEKQKTVDELVAEVLAEVAKQPELSDEEFMAEFEVSAEEYAMGITLPTPSRKK